MKLQTTVDIPKSTWQIEHTDKVMLIGSCFADEVGERFVRGGFDAMVNPFGTLYNPASIAAILNSLVRPSPDPFLSGRRVDTEPSAAFTNGKIVTTPRPERKGSGEGPWSFFEDNQGIWHSWMHHSKFSAHSKEELQKNISSITESASNFLHEADVLIITFGTSIIYRLKETGMLVANCHKQLDSLFTRERLSAYDIVDQWNMLLQLLHSINPKLRVIFTVSPIRHKRDGYHVNQISKGILLQAVDELSPPSPKGGVASGLSSLEEKQICTYFPSYEIMLDELRDYRFYADDMIHPSPLAVSYIWERFQDTFFSNVTKDKVAKSNKEWSRGAHREIVK